MLEKIKEYSPKEVYALSLIYGLCLFLNMSELFRPRSDFEDIFSISGSLIYSLIRGIGDDHISYAHASLFYWLSLATYLFLVILKAQKISAWLWDR